MSMQSRLYEKFPRIFRRKDMSPQQSCMSWGISCGEGWENILYSACASIQGHIDSSRRSRAMYLINVRNVKRALKHGHIEKLADEIFSHSFFSERKQEFLNDPIGFYKEVDVVPQVEAEQIKEKFGTLRFYYYGGDSHIEGIVNMAENLSAITCEECGKPGKIINTGWLKCRCEECMATGK